MADAPSHILEDDTGAVLVRAGISGALLAFAGLVAVAMSRNGWVFEYPLDDVYIHLAMAEQIAQGGYGVNAGEFASAASSPIYPLFLTPFSGSSVQRWLPLVWSVVALATAAGLLSLAFSRAGLGRTGVALAAAAPLALSMHVTAFSGMENMAHGAASLAVVLGLWRFVQTDRIGLFLILGILLASAFRLEGMALGMAAGGVVALLGRPRSGLALRHGVTVANAPGTVDSDYRGEVGVILINLGLEAFTVSHGLRVAQIVFAPVTRAAWREDGRLGETARGAGGFGSTGTGA